MIRLAWQLLVSVANERCWYKLQNETLLFNCLFRLRSASSIVLQKNVGKQHFKSGWCDLLVDRKSLLSSEPHHCEDLAVGTVLETPPSAPVWVEDELCANGDEKKHSSNRDRSTDVVVWQRWLSITIKFIHHAIYLKEKCNTYRTLYELRKNFPSFCVPCWLYPPRLFCILTSETTKSDAPLHRDERSAGEGASDWRN